MFDQQDADASWAALREAAVSRKRGKLRRHEIALFVGAGASYGTGRHTFPDWEKFTAKILKRTNIDSNLLKELKLPLPAQIGIARALYLENHKNDKSWPELIRDVLYADSGIGSSPREQAKKPDDALAKIIEKHYPTIASIVAFCARTGTSGAVDVDANGKFIANPRVGAVLTYNLDSLIQLYDRARHGTPRIFRTVERASKNRWAGKINLYHLHGYIQRFPESARNEAADQLILTETEYHDRTDDAHGFANASTLWALREFICMFIGCSMTDELMRRSLHRSLRERKMALEAEGNKDSKAQRHFAVVKMNNKETDDLRGIDLQVLGVNPLWVSDFCELPVRLECFARELQDQDSEAERIALK